MPELPEVEAYRQLAEDRALDREISAVAAPDDWYLKGTTEAELRAVLSGDRFVSARRIGKLLLLDTSSGSVLGLRFGMTGRLLVDGRAGVDRLIYSSAQELEQWDRFMVTFADGGDLRIRDPRRLGGVIVDPDEDALGPDARSIPPAALRDALAGTTAPVKARLMDQARIAGIGNLLVDEMLWRAGLDPRREAGTLSSAEIRRLHRHLRSTIEDLIARGGSHMGDFLPHRVAGGTCPRDGAPLRQARVGGRTTFWCSKHQR